MAKHQWSVLCRRGITDKDDNSMSLIEVLEEISLVGLVPKEIDNEDVSKESSPATAPAAAGIQLVTLWIRSDQAIPESGAGRIRVKSERGKFILTQEFPIVLTNSIRTRHTIRFSSVPFDGHRIYSYLTQQNKGTEEKPRWVTVSELLLNTKQTSDVQTAN